MVSWTFPPFHQFFAVWVVLLVFVCQENYQEHDFLNTEPFPLLSLVWGKHASRVHRMIVKAAISFGMKTDGFQNIEDEKTDQSLEKCVDNY